MTEFLLLLSVTTLAVTFVLLLVAAKSSKDECQSKWIARHECDVLRDELRLMTANRDRLDQLLQGISSTMERYP